MAIDQRRIGITMRVVQASGYHEPRDALAQDWPRFLAACVPSAAWLPVPNLGASAVEAFCSRWGIDALILSGGDDIGQTPVRDDTENALLTWAAALDLPVLGVCRGMQVMGVWAGAVLKPIAGHARTRHRVSGVLDAEVNSFHRFALDSCPPQFVELARSEDGELEAMRHASRPWEAWMWHPERERVFSDADMQRVRQLFQ
jgi:putative glutamine amidotransferase